MKKKPNDCTIIKKNFNFGVNYGRIFNYFPDLEFRCETNIKNLI